jgi:hypothetical protein
MRYTALILAAMFAWADPSPAPARAVRVPVRVASGSVPITFTVQMDGKPAKVDAALTPKDSQMILVVLDLTGDFSLIDPAKQAIIDSVRKLPPTTYVSLLRAQDGLSVLVDPTSDRETIATALTGLTVTGRPGLIEVIEDVQKLADSIARKSRVRVGVIYVTDSDVEYYREDFTNPVINSSDPHDLSRKFPEQLIQEKISKLDSSLTRRQSSMHIVHLANRTDRLNDAYQNGLRRLADAAAGTSVFCRSTAEIPQAIQNAFAAAAGEYSLIIDSPEHPPDRAQVAVSAKDGSGDDVALIYRGYVRLKEK